MTPPAITPDQAFAAFQQAEAQLTTDQTGLSTANTNLTAAQLAQQTAAATVSADVAAYIAAGNAAIASIQAGINSVSPPVTPPPGSAAALKG